MDKADVVDVMLDNIEKEYVQVARSGLNNNNLDLAWKLTEMYYRLMLVRNMQKPSSIVDADYMTAKRNYRKNCCEETKSDVIKSLSKKLQSMQIELQSIWRDADFLEERKVIEEKGWL